MVACAWLPTVISSASNTTKKPKRLGFDVLCFEINTSGLRYASKRNVRDEIYTERLKD